MTRTEYLLVALMAAILVVGARVRRVVHVTGDIAGRGWVAACPMVGDGYFLMRRPAGVPNPADFAISDRRAE
jgi:hypothetical protein